MTRPPGSPTPPNWGDALAEVIDELGLPAFRVPAPKQSAQHRAATAFHSRVLQDRSTDRHPNVGTADVRPPDPRRDTRVFSPAELPLPAEAPLEEAEYQPVTGQFAGIELEQFHWARQRSKRVLAAWVVFVLILAGLLAMGAWTLGNNLPNLV